MRLTSILVSPVDTGGAAAAAGIRLPSPLPNAFLFMRHELPGEAEVRLGPPRSDVVEHDRLAVAGRLSQADIARDDRLVDPLAEDGADLFDDLAREVRAVVGHGHHDALDL